MPYTPFFLNLVKEMPSVPLLMLKEMPSVLLLSYLGLFYFQRMDYFLWVDATGFEPATHALQRHCSTN